jgi:DNA-binding transcriptional regulator LsrR (DeoR family)
MRAKVRRVNVVVTSMGPILENPDDSSEMNLSNDPALNLQLIKEARNAGAIGEVCYWCFDRDGRKVETPYEAIGLGFDGLRRIAQDPARTVILVTGGDRRRFEPLRAALRAGLVSVLVSDTVTARYLVGEL